MLGWRQRSVVRVRHRNLRCQSQLPLRSRTLRNLIPPSPIGVAMGSAVGTMFAIANSAIQIKPSESDRWGDIISDPLWRRAKTSIRSRCATGLCENCIAAGTNQRSRNLYGSNRLIFGVLCCFELSSSIHQFKLTAEESAAFTSSIRT